MEKKHESIPDEHTSTNKNVVELVYKFINFICNREYCFGLVKLVVEN